MADAEQTVEGVYDECAQDGVVRHLHDETVLRGTYCHYRSEIDRTKQTMRGKMSIIYTLHNPAQPQIREQLSQPCRHPVGW